MIISCPSCGASFNIKSEALGPNGRSVKCSKCAHRWHASADGEAQAEQATAAPEGADAPAAAPQADQDAGDSAGSTTDSGAAEFGDTGTAGTEPGEDAAAHASDDPAAEPPPVPPDLRDALGLGADAAAEEDATASRGRRRVGAPARKPRRSIAKILSIFVVLLLVGAAGSAAVVMKQQVMMWLPATQRLYAMIGLEPEVLGHGLKIVEPNPKKEIDGNDEILIVEGEVRNIAEKPVDVPLMRGALLDKQGKELHIWTFTAAKSRIGPGELAQYRTEFRNPPSDAQSLDITFTRTNAASAKHEVKLESKPEGQTAGKPESGTATGGAAQQH